MARGRSLRSYLLLPRPGDSVKWAVFPAAFVVGVLARGGISAERVLSAAVLWFILELLIYQARYQWNDIRGFAADQLHPQAATRGRLPGPPERGPVNKLASYVVAAGRLVLALVLAMVVPGLTPTGVAALALGVFGLAVAYEALRGRATGRSSAMPPPLTPSLIALWLVVGGGYALRGMAGLAVAFDLPPSVVPAAVAAIALWSFGVAFVTGRWALEALAFARMDGGQLTWSAGRQHAREHSLALVRWLPDRPSSLSATGGGLDGWQALWEHSGKVSPWSVAAAVTGFAAPAAGVLLSEMSPGAAVCAAIFGGLLTVLILQSARRWAAWLASALALALVMEVVGAQRPALAMLPWFMLIGAHLVFAYQSPGSLAHPMRPLGAAIRPKQPRPRLRATPRGSNDRTA